jgi:hypothetical protein
LQKKKFTSKYCPITNLSCFRLSDLRSHAHVSWMSLWKKRIFIRKSSEKQCLWIALIEVGVWINSNPLPANVTFSNCDKFTSDSNSTDVSDYRIHKEYLQTISIREEPAIRQRTFFNPW